MRAIASPSIILAILVSVSILSHAAPTYESENSRIKQRSRDSQQKQIACFPRSQHSCFGVSRPVSPDEHDGEIIRDSKDVDHSLRARLGFSGRRSKFKSRQSFSDNTTKTPSQNGVLNLINGNHQRRSKPSGRTSDSGGGGGIGGSSTTAAIMTEPITKDGNSVVFRRFGGWGGPLDLRTSSSRDDSQLPRPIKNPYKSRNLAEDLELPLQHKAPPRQLTKPQAELLLQQPQPQQSQPQQPPPRSSNRRLTNPPFTTIDYNKLPRALQDSPEPPLTRDSSSTNILDKSTSNASNTLKYPPISDDEAREFDERLRALGLSAHSFNLYHSRSRSGAGGVSVGTGGGTGGGSLTKEDRERFERDWADLVRGIRPREEFLRELRLPEHLFEKVVRGGGGGAGARVGEDNEGGKGRQGLGEKGKDGKDDMRIRGEKRDGEGGGGNILQDAGGDGGPFANFKMPVAHVKTSLGFERRGLELDYGSDY